MFYFYDLKYPLCYEVYLAFSKMRKSFPLEWKRLEPKMFVYSNTFLFPNIFFLCLFESNRYFYETILLFESHVMSYSPELPVCLYIQGTEIPRNPIKIELH